jgi:hypothetical protein
MALTVAQLEAHAGRLLRQFLTHAEPAVVTQVAEPLATAIANAGKNYVLNGTIGTQAERIEAVTTIVKALYTASQPGSPNPEDGARGQHGFENHWFPARQRGE